MVDNKCALLYYYTVIFQLPYNTYQDYFNTYFSS